MAIKDTGHSPKSGQIPSFGLGQDQNAGRGRFAEGTLGDLRAGQPRLARACQLGSRALVSARCKAVRHAIRSGSSGGLSEMRGRANADGRRRRPAPGPGLPGDHAKDHPVTDERMAHGQHVTPVARWSRFEIQTETDDESRENVHGSAAYEHAPDRSAYARVGEARYASCVGSAWKTRHVAWSWLCAACRPKKEAHWRPDRSAPTDANACG